VAFKRFADHCSRSMPRIGALLFDSLASSEAYRTRLKSDPEASENFAMVNGAYNFLDLAPKVRDEDGFKFSVEWVRGHDQ
jgi:predicted dithiol-disulfide oxidoreductase (DUF899 family)